MANQLASAKQMKPVDIKALDDTPDHGGGIMYQGSEGGSSNGSKAPGNAKASQIDGPYGGKVKA